MSAPVGLAIVVALVVAAAAAVASDGVVAGSACDPWTTWDPACDCLAADHEAGVLSHASSAVAAGDACHGADVVAVAAAASPVHRTSGTGTAGRMSEEVVTVASAAVVTCRPDHQDQDRTSGGAGAGVAEDPEDPLIPASGGSCGSGVAAAATVAAAVVVAMAAASWMGMGTMREAWT